MAAAELVADRQVQLGEQGLVGVLAKVLLSLTNQTSSSGLNLSRAVAAAELVAGRQVQLEGQELVGVLTKVLLLLRCPPPARARREKVLTELLISVCVATLIVG